MSAKAQALTSEAEELLQKLSKSEELLSKSGELVKRKEAQLNSIRQAASPRELV